MKQYISFYSREVKNVASKGFFYLFTTHGFIVVIGFATQFFVAGFLDPTDIGRIKIMQTYINLSVLVCGLGFETSLLKLASESSDVAVRKRLYQTAFLVSLCSFTVVYSVLYLLSVLNLVSSDAIITKMFPGYMLFLLPLTLQNIQLAYYQAEKRIKTMARLQFIMKSISVVAIVIFTYLFKLNGYIATVVITGFMGALIFELGIKNIRIGFNYFQLEFKLVARMWKLAGFAMLANMVGMLAATVDVYLINYLVEDRKEVGYYMFALTIISVFQLLPLTIQQISFPFFSQQSLQYDRWFNSYFKYNRLNHILVVLFVLTGILIFPFLIKIAFSGKYDASIFYFIFLSFAWMMRSSNLIKSTAMMGYGRFDLNFIISLVVLLISFPIFYYLIQNKGLTGALAGALISSVISYTMVFFIFRRFNRMIRTKTYASE